LRKSITLEQKDWQAYSYDASFCTHIGKTGQAIARRIQANWKKIGCEITVEQWSILVRLYAQDGQSQQELSVCTGRDKPGITRLIDTMEKNNLVVRIPDKTDRRVRLIYLTHKAKVLQQSLTEQVLQSLDEATAGIDERMLQTCRTVLEKICANLAEQA
jgi:DNA-binding MarR family transcriptional regulator